MADSKITALTALTSADPANDMIPIVDVSDTPPASGNTKRISINNILAASGTATLASATITGDLTVDTSTLKVDSANNRVGIGTATPLVPLHAETAGTGTTAFDNFVATFRSQAAGRDATLQFSDGTNQAAISMLSGALSFGTGGANTRYRIDNTGISTWSVAGTTAMTLNATGLGVGASPLGKFDVYNTGADTTTFIRSDTTRLGQIVFRDNADSANQGRVKYDHSTDTLSLYSGGNENVFLSSSGNVGIGVTPSGTIYSSSETRLVVKGTATSYAGTVGVQSKGTTNAVTGFLTAGDGVNEVALGSATNTPINFYTNNVLKATIDTSGNLILQSSATPATLTTNGQLTVNATSNTNLRFSYRGSDGVTRVANITLA